MYMNWFGAILFIIGIIAIAVGVTYFPMKPLMLGGIVLAGAGVMFSSLFKES
jgi:hypothetical protein